MTEAQPDLDDFFAKKDRKKSKNKKFPATPTELLVVANSTSAKKEKDEVSGLRRSNPSGAITFPLCNFRS